jgi:sodium transport system permease protein
MRIKTVQAIFKKEMTDTLRDRRTLIFMLAVPIAAIPLLMMGLSSLVMGQMKKVQEQKADIVVEGMANLPDTLQELLRQSSSMSVRTDDEFADKNALDELKAGAFDALVVVPQSFDKALRIESPTEIEVFYDEAEIESEVAVSKLKDVLNPYRDSLIVGRLKQRGLNEDIIKPFQVVSENVAPPQKVGGRKLGAMLPYLIIIMCFMGAMYPAIDLAAGEKERGTLETLLVSPASRAEFVIGKYLVIMSTGVIAALLSMVSMTFSLNYMVEDMISAAAQLLAIKFDLPTVVLIFAIVLPLAGIFAALLLSVSIFARSFKEAQSYITALNMMIIFPAFISFLPGVKLDFKMALIPVVNVSMIIMNAIIGEVEWKYVITAFVSSVVYAAITLYLAKKWFEKESVLFRT